jgi:hypothetical protein
MQIPQNGEERKPVRRLDEKALPSQGKGREQIHAETGA